MPFVLDYDNHGNVVGGHVVEDLQQNPLLSPPYHGQLSNPLYGHHASLSTSNDDDPLPPSSPHTEHQQPSFVQIQQAPMRSSSPTQTKGSAFLDSFTKNFANDESTMLAFEQLFTNFNQKAIDETDFYTGVYMLLSRTGSWNLLPGLVEVLPATWQTQDLTWLHRAAEAVYEDKPKARGTFGEVITRDSSDNFESAVYDVMDRIPSDAMERIPHDAIEGVSPDTHEHSLSLMSDVRPSVKRAKKPPVNGFRTSYTSNTTVPRSMYVDPKALMIHRPAINTMTDLDEGSDIPMTDELPVRKGLVKLKLKFNPRPAKPELVSPRRVSQKKSTKVKGSSPRKTTTMSGLVNELIKPVRSGKRARDHTVRNKSPETLPKRKGSTRYGDMFAAEIEHFGHFPTRRAVIARTSRPYVHLPCGKGFSHPMDVKDHHRNRERTNGGAGCPGKDGVPQGEDDKWDDHPSARVEYPDLNYTKVKDGYVICDQQSRDKIDNAIAAGLDYLAKRGSHDRDVTSDGDPEMETEMEMEEDAED